jgi:hypothetical protein
MERHERKGMEEEYEKKQVKVERWMMLSPVGSSVVVGGMTGKGEGKSRSRRREGPGG